MKSDFVTPRITLVDTTSDSLCHSLGWHAVKFCV